MSDGLTISNIEPVTNCDRFNSAANWKSYLVISNDNSLRPQVAMVVTNES